MNGIGLLVLISLFGQVGAPTLPATPSVSQGDERDFGWQISPEDGALEYIVQISPQVVQVLQLSKDQFASHMPPALVGRATRVVVQVGSGVLPRQPSLRELESYPRINSSADLQAALGPGGFSNVESESLKNVQGGSLPPLPGLPGAGSLSDAADNVIDRAASAAANLPDTAGSIAQQLRDDFLSGARNSPPPNTGGVGANLGANPRTPVSPQPNNLGTGGSKFNSTAPPPLTDPALAGGTTSGSGTSLPPLNSRPASSEWGNQVPQMTDNRQPAGFSDQSKWAPATDPRALEQQYAPPTRNDFSTGIAQRGQMPGRSLADQLEQERYGYNSRDPRDGYAADGYPIASGNPNLDRSGYPYADRRDPFAADGYAGAVDRRQDPLRMASSDSLPGTTPKSVAAEDKSPTDTQQSSAGSAPAQGNGNYWQVFLLLSLVVNIYLGILINKLLNRYRSLLANVRSQTA